MKIAVTHTDAKGSQPAALTVIIGDPDKDGRMETDFTYGDGGRYQNIAAAMSAVETYAAGAVAAMDVYATQNTPRIASPGALRIELFRLAEEVANA